MKRGIDVSSHQGMVDFEQVKQAGYDFVIIKAGQGLSEMRTFRERYLPAVQAAGLEWGAYWWTDASTVEGARAEAKAFVKALDGLRPTYPLYVDQEYGTPSDRLGMSAEARQLRTDMVLAFTKMLRDAGYLAGLYTSTDWMNTRLYDEQLGGVEKWVAQYASACTYKGDYGMWQHTVIGVQGNKNRDYWTYGQVPGVNANCDANICYVDYPGMVKAGGWNGWDKQGASSPTPAPEGGKVISVAELVRQGYVGMTF